MTFYKISSKMYQSGDNGDFHDQNNILLISNDDICHLEISYFNLSQSTS